MLSPEQIATLNKESQTLQPREILKRAMELAPGTAIAFSGAEDIALVDMAVKINPDIAVFTLDTGRLHPETYRFIELARKHYQLNLEILTPESAALQKLVSAKGLFSFYEEGHDECCQVRKIAPLRRKLATLEGWMSGQRRDQSPTRTQMPVFEIDPAFPGRNGPLLKVNPLANWSLSEVWNYIRLLEVPYNPLHDRGYVSIGCEPCTRPVGPGQHEREGRWWWEEATIKECGLHGGNLKPGS